MSTSELWLAIASVVVPSVTVMFFAWLNHRNSAKAAAASEDRDGKLGSQIEKLGDRLDSRIERVRSDVTTMSTLAAYAAGRREDAEERAERRPQDPDEPAAPDTGPGPTH